MFNINVTKFDLPAPYYSVKLSLPDEAKAALDNYDEFFSFLYKLGDSLFGEEYQAAFFAFGVYYDIPEDKCPEFIKIMGNAAETIYKTIWAMKME